MFGVSGVGSACSFANVAITAGVVVDARTCVIIHDSVDVCSLQCVLGMDQMLSKGAPGFDGG